MPTRNVVLSDRQAALVTRLVESGRYQNASEVMRAGLRMVERQEAEDEVRLQAMREAVNVGLADLAAGRYQTFETPEALREGLAAIVEEALGSPPVEDGA